MLFTRILTLAAAASCIATAASAYCTRSDIDEVIAEVEFPFGAGEPTSRKEQMTEIGKRLQIYHTYAVRPDGSYFYAAKVTNGERIKGFTVCACINFVESTTDFPLMGMGGRWGVSPGQTNTPDPIIVKTAPETIQFVDKVTIAAGYCPSDRILKQMTKTALDISWGIVRAYLVKAGIPSGVLPD
jgi:hypothetical protein